MKKSLLIALGLLFTANVFAKDLASFRFTFIENLEGKSVIHHMVSTITDEAELKVVLNSTTGSFPFFIDGERAAEETFSKELNKHVFELLKSDIIGLSQAEIEHKTNQVVCMMMPGPAMSSNHLTVLRGYDRNIQDFTGKMELVSGPNGCWVRNATFPKQGYGRAIATSLKGLIKALTLDHIGAEL